MFTKNLNPLVQSGVHY